MSAQIDVLHSGIGTTSLLNQHCSTLTAFVHSVKTTPCSMRPQLAESFTYCHMTVGLLVSRTFKLALLDLMNVLLFPLGVICCMHYMLIRQVNDGAYSKTNVECLQGGSGVVAELSHTRADQDGQSVAMNDTGCFVKNRFVLRMIHYKMDSAAPFLKTTKKYLNPAMWQCLWAHHIAPVTEMISCNDEDELVQFLDQSITNGTVTRETQSQQEKGSTKETHTPQAALRHPTMNYSAPRHCRTVRWGDFDPILTNLVMLLMVPI